ncbi:hypothetical protein FB45DRAFT_38531 [Roridomyces roridus]|uniref:Uncharacterized protein n=1 Tax=Roridomyces roridus TaxID=1738132 RepID=A0AAD7BRI8_9AGAR|nr:hypothetical protein FB45DRAFT_38531 [Roridomyces roridus]
MCSCTPPTTFSLLQRKYLPSRSHSHLSSLWTHTSSRPSSGYRWPRREACRVVDHTPLTHKCIDDLSPSTSLPQWTHTSLDIFESPRVSSMSLILFASRHPCPLTPLTSSSTFPALKHVLSSRNISVKTYLGASCLLRSRCTPGVATRHG